MRQYNFKTSVREILADTVTPVSVYLKMRDIFPNALLLESSDHHSLENSYSFICLKPEASIEVAKFNMTFKYPDGQAETGNITRAGQLAEEMEAFFNCFKAENHLPDQPGNFLKMQRMCITAPMKRLVAWSFLMCPLLARQH